jgi:MFS family permease
MASAEIRTRRTALVALSVLTLINLLNYLDRYVPSAIVTQLKASPLALSDTQVGTLQTAFMLVYMVTAPVFGRLGDRGSRTRPIAIGVFLWSLATALSGLAQDYTQLLAGRAAVGIGEAAYVAIAPALLSDFYAESQRGRVLSILNMAIPVGAALGYVVGGLVGQHYGWRAAFFVAGAPGMLLAALVLGLPDPPRGSKDTAAVAGGATSTLPQASRGAVGESVRVYWSLLQRAPYLLIVLGYAAYTFAVGGLAFWMPQFLERVRGIPAAQATTGFGAIVIVTGFLGTFIGGWLGDYGLRYSRQAYLWLSGAATLIAVPFAIVALTAEAPAVFYPAIVLAELLLFMSTGPINAAIVNGVSPLERASAVALSMFMIHLLGDVPSPTLIGQLSDLSSLGNAVLIVPVAVAISGVLWLLAARVDARAPAGAPAQQSPLA